MNASAKIAIFLVLPLLVACADAAPEEGQTSALELAALNTTSATLSLTPDWGSGYCASVRIKNTGASTISNWSTLIELNQSKLTSIWDARWSQSGTRLTVTNAAWNGTIAPGASTNFGFCAIATGTNYRPRIVQDSAALCSNGTEKLSTDLSVQYISRTPRFAQLKINYEPNGYNPTLAPESAGKQWPDPGDPSTFTARVRNLGSARSRAVGYRWLMDGSVVAQGEIPALAANATRDISLNWPWKDGDHTVRFELRSQKCSKLNDGHAVNNAREQRTNALLLTTYVWDNFATWMAGHDNAVGTRSAEDWIQYHADQMNALFASSTSPLAPDGVKLRIAIDRVIRVPSNTPDPGGTHAPEACPTDGCWGFGGPPENWLDWINGVHNRRDDGLLHEWGHQLGLIDLYQMDVQASECRINEGEPAVRSASNSSAGEAIDRLFDENVAEPLATYESRPVWFALSFNEPRFLDRMRMQFWGTTTHVWQVFSADTLEDAVSMSPPAVARTGTLTAEGSQWSELSFPRASAKVWLVHVDRLDFDRMTHVTEWELYDGSTRLAIPQLLTSARVAGTPLMPFIAWDVVHYNSIPNDLMSGASYELDPYHAWALNTDANFQNRGLPLRRGYYGKYLFEIPAENSLVVKRAGKPLAGAKIEIFHQQDSIIPDVPKFVGNTDAAGRFRFPHQTTAEYALAFNRSQPISVENPFSTVFSAKPNVIGFNGVLVIRITSTDGVRAYRFLDTPQFNLEFARGHAEGVYPLEL